MTKKLLITAILIAAIALASPLAVVPYALSESGSGNSNSGSGGGGSEPEDVRQTDATFTKDLRPKMKSEDVAKLQKELADAGLFKAVATGFFGALTERAVKKFQKEHGLPETGVVDSKTRAELNVKSANKGTGTNSGQGNARAAGSDTAGKIQALTEAIKNLQKQLQKLLDDLDKLGAAAAPASERPIVQSEKVDAAVQAAAGIIITGAVSGPGYPTGPLNLTLPATQLLFDRAGQTKQGGGQLEIKDRQYEAPLETIPPTLGAFPVTINGVANTATQLKVISSLKTKDGVGQHQGSIDVDIDTVPAGHLTLAYSGTATVVGSTITSKGTFKTAKTTGIFAGLIAEGTYEMTIVESGSVAGAPVTVSLVTTSP